MQNFKLLVAEADDPSAYARLTWLNKFKILVNHSGIQIQELTTILGAEHAALNNLLEGRDHTSQTWCRADRLFSVLAFLRRLSANDPVEMQRLWKSKNLYAECLDIPPWDEVGLANFIVCDPRAVEVALAWIRKH